MIDVTVHVTIRPMEPDDIEQAAALEQQSYSQPWNTRVFAEELEQDSRTYLVADCDEGLLGYAGLMVIGDEAHVTTVVVRPDRREDRLGTRLMLGLASSAIERGARSLTLEVRVSNEPAQALYRRFGMAPVGVRKRYYQDEDALIMWVHEIDGPEFAERIAEIRGGLT